MQQAEKRKVYNYYTVTFALDKIVKSITVQASDSVQALFIGRKIIRRYTLSPGSDVKFLSVAHGSISCE